MPSLQTFLVHGINLGSREVPTWIDGLDGLRIHPTYVYFCPYCKDIWAKLLIDHPDSFGNVEVRACEKHGDGTLSAVPHHFPTTRDFDASWPPMAVHHEFTVLITKAILEIESERNANLSNIPESYRSTLPRRPEDPSRGTIGNG